MKIWNKILVIIILFFNSDSIFGTAQIPDFLIVNSDTTSLHANPLELLYNENTRPKSFFDKEPCGLTSCWRGYYAYWQLENNKLYLIKIVDCCDEKVTANLKKIFGSKFNDNKVFAYWVSDTLLSPQGKLIWYEHMRYGSLYEKEVMYVFDKGIFKDKFEYDNSKSYISAFTQHPDTLKNFLYSRINWNNLPDINDENKRVFIKITSGETKDSYTIQIMRGFNEILDNEALRVIKLLPEWDVFYRQGKIYNMSWTITILFNSEMKQKYYNK